MTKSYTHGEADYTPNDIGPTPNVGNIPLTPEEREKLDEVLIDADISDLIF